MVQFTKEQLDEIWAKGQVDPKYNPDFVRKDDCGAWMIRGRYRERDNIYGWEVDHIYPESKLKRLNVPQEKIDNIDNLRPLNCRNNMSKGSDYPHYQAKMKSMVVTDEGGKVEDYNVECEEEKEINPEIQQSIEELLRGYSL